jgi:hypothetical protein
MFNRTLLALWVGVLMMPGCGGDATTIVETGDMTVLGADLAGAHLMAGTYTVSNIVKKSDGCGLIFEGDAMNPALATLPLANTGTMLSIGNMYGASTTPQFNPPGYSAGTGPYTDSTHATLTLNTTETLPDTCFFTKMVTTVATFTGNNKLSVDYTDVESNYDATKCASDMPPMTPPCTSHYTFDLAM